MFLETNKRALSLHGVWLHFQRYKISSEFGAEGLIETKTTGGRCWLVSASLGPWDLSASFQIPGIPLTLAV